MALGEQFKPKPNKSLPGFLWDVWNIYSDATHIGNQVLGHIALTMGEVNKAKEHLLAAGRVPGSAVLNSFGPNMRLAKELIEKGERETVIEYFDLCAKFWRNHDGRWERWKEIVSKGGIPDFGSTLGTQLDTWRFAR